MRSFITIAALLFGACSADSGTGDDVVADPLCGNGTVDTGEACDDGNADQFDGCLATCDEVETLDAPPLTWTYYEIPGTQCIDGSPSGFSVNLNPDSDKVLIYLEGGGACFNSYCDSLFTWSGESPNATGIFDRENAANPVADWSLVYVPYCSGDIYAGDKDTELGGEMRHFHGYSNFTAFLQRWVPAFVGVDQVVLSGSSAGGFGAMSNFSQTQRAFGETPVTLIDDSAPPMSSETFPPCLQQIFSDAWGLDGTLVADCGDDCTAGDDYVQSYLDHIRNEFPDLQGGVFSSLQDTTIRLFAGYGWSGGWNMCSEFPTSVTGPAYTTGLDQLRAHLEDGGPGLGTYYIAGSSHTVLRSGGFYSMSAAGISPAQWFTSTIEGTASHVGPQ